MINVYLSYAPQDQERAEEVRRILLAQGHRPWLERTPATIQAGMPEPRRPFKRLTLWFCY